jgi:hypothetical protein
VPDDHNIPIAERSLARFQSEHPDVKFLFPLITRWGSEKFGMYNHISREYTFLSSERLGKALGSLIRAPNSIPPFAPGFKGEGAYPAVTVTPLGPPDPALVVPALALYLYASTADRSYEQLIAKPALDLLAAEPSFRYMMADALERNNSLAARNIKIGFDLTDMHATPVSVSGLPECDVRPGVEWVQIYGNMIFTYSSPTSISREPVPWPQGSRILIPTIMEDGTRKFDGYCPELSLREGGE